MGNLSGLQLFDDGGGVLGLEVRVEIAVSFLIADEDDEQHREQGNPGD
ncbi:MAG: hypothetical protein QM784_06670 [Polyangiaceae bacterium]